MLIKLKRITALLLVTLMSFNILAIPNQRVAKAGGPGSIGSLDGDILVDNEPYSAVPVSNYVFPRIVASEFFITNKPDVVMLHITSNSGYDDEIVGYVPAEGAYYDEWMATWVITWTVSPEAQLIEGLYNVSVDFFMNGDAAPFYQNSYINSFEIDTTKPVITVDRLVTNSEEPIITGTVSDKNLTKLVINVDDSTYSIIPTGTSWSLRVGPLESGVYDVLALAYDKAGNVRQDSTINEIVFDNLPPYTPGLKTPLDEKPVKSNPSLVFTWDDKPIEEMGKVKWDFEISTSAALEVDGTAFATPIITQNSFEMDVPNHTIYGGLEENITYFWHVRARDEAGNTSDWSAPFSFQPDNKAPTFDSIEDVITNVATDIEIANIVDADVANVIYEWTELTGKVVFENEQTHKATLKATENGTYEVSVKVTDRAGNFTTKSFKFTWDTTVNPVTDLYVLQGDAYVDLHWTNPADKDLAGVKILRSISGESTWYELAVLNHGEVLYQDEAVLNGVAYKYKVVAFDELGNKSEKEISATPQLALVTLEEEDEKPYTYGYSSNAPKQVEEKVTQEVKSEEKEGDVIEKEENKNLPAVGVGILVLLALVGLYLLYLQNPNWFGFLKKKKSNVKKLK